MAREATSTDSLLSPYRVIDLTDEKGFMCAKVLADMGADVIKIERPGGDAARGIGPFFQDDPNPEKSLSWLFLNMNKRGITLDVAKPEGQGLLRRFVEGADFVVESFEPGYLDALGLGFRDLSRVNPRVIVTSITPFGQDGPHAHFRSTDLTSMARGGLMYMTGDPDRAPVRVGVPQAFLHGGAEGAAASMIAHYHRESTGRGQHVDVSIQECVIWTTMDATGYWDLNGINRQRSGTVAAAPKASLRSLWPCRDGFVTLMVAGGMTMAVQFMQALLGWMDQEGAAPEFLKALDWMTDYDRNTVTQDLVDRVEGVVGDFLMTKTKAEIFDQGMKRRFMQAPAADGRDIAESRQLADRDYFVTLEHSNLGPITYPGPFLKLSETPIDIRRPAPRIGEHNEEVFMGELGLSAEELAGLQARGVV